MACRPVRWRLRRRDFEVDQYPPFQSLSDPVNEPWFATPAPGSGSKYNKEPPRPHEVEGDSFIFSSSSSFPTVQAKILWVFFSFRLSYCSISLFPFQYFLRT